MDTHSEIISQTARLLSDGRVRDEMLESVASVADEAGTRVLMGQGRTREDACKLINPTQPTKPPSLSPGGKGNGEKSPKGI